MEREKNFMSKLSDLEFRLLDEVYFISSYKVLFENLDCSEDVFQQTLRSLLENKFINQLKYNDMLFDFEKLEIPDYASLEESSFVATKLGLLIHNSRN
jgi:hypothetical protein